MKQSQAVQRLASRRVNQAKSVVPDGLGSLGPWIAVAWAIEGAVLVWSGMRTSLRWLRVSGLTLFGLVARRRPSPPRTRRSAG